MDHSVNRRQIVRLPNGSVIQMFSIRIPTVFDFILKQLNQLLWVLLSVETVVLRLIREVKISLKVDLIAIPRRLQTDMPPPSHFHD